MFRRTIHLFAALALLIMPPNVAWSMSCGDALGEGFDDKFSDEKLNRKYPLRRFVKEYFQLWEHTLSVHIQNEVFDLMLRLPRPKPITMKALKDFYNLSENASSQTAREAIQELLISISEDPYFDDISEQGRHNLIYHLSFKGPDSLPPDLALLRVQRDYGIIDSELTTGIDRILNVRKALMTVMTVSQQLYLENSKLALGFWRLAKTAHDPFMHRKKIYNTVDDLFGHLFPEESYERLGRLLGRGDGDTIKLLQDTLPLIRTSSTGRLPIEHQSKFERRLRFLANQLGLPDYYDIYSLPTHIEAYELTEDDGYGDTEAKYAYTRFLVLSFYQPEQSYQKDMEFQFLNILVELLHASEIKGMIHFLEKHRARLKFSY